MKKVLVLLVIFTIASCARIDTPMGGPEDETPPTFLVSTPPNQSTNFNGQVITLTFDEWITTKNIESDLIITPKIETGFKPRIKKQQLQLLFNEPFQENTTYTLSFASTIEDITNQNAITGLTLSFSTGPILDSLEIEGAITNLYEQEPAENYLVSLYSKDDSLSILNGAASYYTKTDSMGRYKFQNLPDGEYRIYAINDKNNNSKADTEEERLGFYSDTVELRQNITGIDFNVQSLNVDRPRITSARPFGKYFDIEFNKYVETEIIQNTSENKSFNIIPDNKLRFYNERGTYNDTTDLILSFTDSAQVQIIDTVKYYFIESKLNPEDLTLSIAPNSGQLKPTDSIVFSFNKPIQTVNPDSLFIQLDSLTNLSINQTDLIFNETKDQITYYTENSNLFTPDRRSINLALKPSAFISIENDTAEAQDKYIAPIRNEDIGSIEGIITTNAANIIVQLVNSRNGNVIANSFDKNYKFDYLTPGSYFVRVINDINGNGRWDIGNILTNQDPEPVYYFYDDFYKTREIQVKKRWEQIDRNISF